MELTLREVEDPSTVVPRRGGAAYSRFPPATLRMKKLFCRGVADTRKYSIG